MNTSANSITYNQHDYCIESLIVEEKVILVNGIVKTKKYKRGKHLGKGGFANCYELTNLENNHTSAAKIIPKSSLLKPRAKQKLITEIKIHKSLNHEGIVQFEHYFEDLDNVYLLLEMCHNQTLNELVKRRRRLCDIEVQCYSLQIIEALKYLHGNMVIHRDLKLGNLFISNDMQLKLGDFGLATKVEFIGERRRTVCGTPNYIAPEILEGTHGHSFEVDIWALGVVMYTLLIGKPPFEASNIKSTYKRIRSCSYTFPDDVEICEEARTLITDILQLNPLKRPSLDDILKYDYFTMNSIPKLLPASTLSVPPNKSYISLFESNSEIKHSKDKTKNRHQYEQIDHIYVKKWIDYSSKYGLAYSLSNGGIGFCFNDYSKMVLTDNSTINYIERKDKKDILYQYSTKEYPYEINKKVKLILHFKKYLDDGQDVPNNTEFVYVKRWLRTKHCVLLRLSNKLIQVIFYDHSILILNSSKKNIVYIDPKNNISYYPLDTAFDSNNVDMKARLKYAKEIITYMIYNTNDYKINGNKINDINLDLATDVRVSVDKKENSRCNNIIPNN
jgi:polo-like kinase 1